MASWRRLQPPASSPVSVIASSSSSGKGRVSAHWTKRHRSRCRTCAPTAAGPDSRRVRQRTHCPRVRHACGHCLRACPDGKQSAHGDGQSRGDRAGRRHSDGTSSALGAPRPSTCWSTFPSVCTASSATSLHGWTPRVRIHRGCLHPADARCAEARSFVLLPAFARLREGAATGTKGLVPIAVRSSHA